MAKFQLRRAAAHSEKTINTVQPTLAKDDGAAVYYILILTKCSLPIYADDKR